MTEALKQTLVAKTHDLMDLYNKNNRNIWSTVVAAAGSLMA